MASYRSLKLMQLGDERAPLALGDAHREQHEEGVQAGLLDLDAARRQELRRPPPRECRAPACVPSADRPGREDGDLDRVDQHVILGEVLRTRATCRPASGPSAACRRPAAWPSPRAARRRTTSEPFSCFFTAVMARRKLSASSIVSCTSARPAGCSIIAAATSQEAMMPYCGEVDVCIMNASLKRVMSSCRVLAVLDVDHRRLRQRGQQLVRRLRGEGDGVRRARRMRRTRWRDSRRRTRGNSRRRTTPRRSAAPRPCRRAVCLMASTL